MNTLVWKAGEKSVTKLEGIDHLTGMMELLMNAVDAANSLSEETRGEVCDLLHQACVCLERSTLN